MACFYIEKKSYTGDKSYEPDGHCVLRHCCVWVINLIRWENIIHLAKHHNFFFEKLLRETNKDLNWGKCYLSWKALPNNSVYISSYTLQIFDFVYPEAQGWNAGEKDLLEHLVVTFSKTLATLAFHIFLCGLVIKLRWDHVCRISPNQIIPNLVAFVLLFTIKF